MAGSGAFCYPLHQRARALARRLRRSGRAEGTVGVDTSGSVPFAHLLRRARVAAGLTQEALAERAGVSVRAISDLERGAKHAPREDTVRLLAAVLGLGAEEAAAFQVAAQAPPAGRGAVASADAGAPGAGTSEGAGGQTAPPAPDLPTGTLTFLLTDIEGSSAYWERYPAAMQGAIARHDALMDEVLARHGGRQIKEHGEGDSIFAVFASAREALAEPWPPETPVLVPIVTGGRVSSLLEVFWDSADRVGPETVAVCAAIAEQAGVALENARLYAAEADLRRRAETRARRLEHVQRVGERLKADLDAGEIAQRVVDATRAASGFRMVVLNLCAVISWLQSAMSCVPR
jgi:transcriptional regulator with XRE-family HTH domain